MVIIGELVKKAIEISQQFERADDPNKIQADQLMDLLTKAKDTAFGLYYGFEQMLSNENPISAYQREVPIFSYADIAPWWEQQQKFPNITWPGQPDYFALSSGTTGPESKRIPVTDDMLQSFRAVSMAQVSSLNNFDLPAAFFEKQILALGSSTNLKEKRSHLEGEISGINASNAPGWFSYFYKPGDEIAQIDDWDERIAAIVETAPSWDIGALAGIPSWVLMMLKAIIKHYKLKSIHELWPDLRVYTTGGVAFEPYRKSFSQLFEKPVFYMDTYLASEGYFAYNARPDTDAMQLALQHGIFYEFIPFDEQGFDETGKLLKAPKVLTIDQVEQDKEYALIVSTPAGAFRYMIGDTIKFTDLTRKEITITGRTKYFLNVVGSQLSEEKLNDAIQQLSKSFDANIKEYTIAALKDKDGEHYHQWILGSEQDIDGQKAAPVLDELLKKLNKNYSVARDKALKDVVVKVVKPNAFYAWLEAQKKKGGQIKVPKVMKAEQMTAFLAYLNG
jgi:uncharacterized FlaG/YvyC family protein